MIIYISSRRHSLYYIDVDPEVGGCLIFHVMILYVFANSMLACDVR